MLNRIKFILIIILYLVSFSTYAGQIDLNLLNNAETQLFNHNFSNETVDQRLNRIEETVFGRIYSDNPDKRLNRLAFFVNNYAKSQPVKLENKQIIVQKTLQDSSATDYPAITQMEMKVFHQGFFKENIYSRLNRLEGRIFGSTFPDEGLAERVERLSAATGNYNDSQEESLATNNDGLSIFWNISSIESALFGQSFDNELISSRLERLEQKIFGAVQSGSTEQRLSRLRLVVENSSSEIVNQDYQNKAVISGNNYLSNGYSNWNDSLFDNQSTISEQKSGLLSLIQALAISLVSGYLNRNNSTETVNPQNYYPYGYNYPYQYPVNTYGAAAPYRYYQNYNSLNPYIQDRIITRTIIQNGSGVGVHILP